MKAFNNVIGSIRPKNIVLHILHKLLLLCVNPDTLEWSSFHTLQNYIYLRN